MCGDGLSVERGTQGWKQKEDSVSWFNEFLLPSGLHCSFLPENKGCRHWGQEETLVWKKGCGDSSYSSSHFNKKTGWRGSHRYKDRCNMQGRMLREWLRTLPHAWGPEELDLWRQKEDKTQFRTDRNINRRLNETLKRTSVEISFSLTRSKSVSKKKPLSGSL